MKYFIAPRSGEKSYKNFQSTIKHGVPYDRIEPYLKAEGKNILRQEEIIYSWGNREGKSKEWQKINYGDIVIFYAKYQFIMAGSVIYKQNDPNLALAMWPPDEKGNPWSYTFFLNNLYYFKIPLQYFNEISGYQFRSVQGFQEITTPHLKLIQNKYPHLVNLFSQFKDDSSIEIPKADEPISMNIPTNINTKFISDFRLKPYTEFIKNIAKKKKALKLINFEEKNRRNAKTGNIGEEIVIDNEKKYLISIGRTDLAKKVKRVSLEDMSAGYDILSYEKNGNQKLIEVKSTILEKGIRFTFNISTNEMEIAKKSKNYYIYIVFAVNSSSPKIFPVKNPFLTEGLLHVEPTQYLVKGSIE
jgi:hypothetical protein